MKERPVRSGGISGPWVEDKDGFLTPKNYVTTETSKEFQKHAQLSRTRWSLTEFLKTMFQQERQSK